MSTTYQELDGRSYVRTRDNHKYYWYRVVMWNELGRELRRDEDVHHVNGDRSDDRVENLLVCSRREHWAIHRAQGDRDETMKRFVDAARRRGAAIRAASRVWLICDECGVEFDRSPSQIKGKRGNFCSPRCHYDFKTGKPRAA